MTTIEVIIKGDTKTVTKQELFTLASQGRIGPQTNILVGGNLVTADRVKGIVFLPEEERLEIIDEPTAHAVPLNVLDLQYNPPSVHYIHAQQLSSGVGRSVTSLVMGILGLAGWIFPFIGFPITIIGLVCGCLGASGQRRSMAIAGIVLNSIGLVLTIINSAIGAYRGATGQLF